MQRGRGGLALGQRRQREPVDLRGHRAVPEQPGTVRPATPAGGRAGQLPEAGQQRADRRGQPRRRCREPDRGAEQVDAEVGGEVDRRLQVCVPPAPGDRRSDRQCGRHGDRHRRAGDRARARADEPVRPFGQPVQPQRGGPPGEVCAVRPGAPGREAPTEGAPTEGAPAVACRRTGDRDPARLDPEDADGQPHGQPSCQVGGAAAGELGRRGQRRAGAEEARANRDPGRRRTGRAGGCRLDHHVLPSQEVVAAVGEGTAGKEKSRDGGVGRPSSRTPRGERVTEPLPDPLRAAGDQPPEPVTSRQPSAKPQVRAGDRGRSPRRPGRRAGVSGRSGGMAGWLGLLW